jgi:hypothetical protein
MMKKKVEVIVTWLNEKALHLPSGLQYITVAKFESDIDTWEKEAWSIVLEFQEAPIKQGNPSKGTAHFLAENAPLERLGSGLLFEMYEGRVKIAEVKIL